MIGVVDARLEPLLPLTVIGPLKPLMVTAVIDTGFTEHLVLPPETIAELGLRFVLSRTSILADGSRSQSDVYEAEVLWDGARRRVEVWSGPEALVGVKLLAGHRLRVDFAVSGKVRVKPLA